MSLPHIQVHIFLLCFAMKLHHLHLSRRSQIIYRMQSIRPDSVGSYSVSMLSQSKCEQKQKCKIISIFIHLLLSLIDEIEMLTFLQVAKQHLLLFSLRQFSYPKLRFSSKPQRSFSKKLQFSEKLGFLQITHSPFIYVHFRA